MSEEKITYKDYENYAQRVYTKINERIIESNVLANEDYSIVMDQKGMGYSKYKQYLVNRYRVTSDETQGIFFYFKNVKNQPAVLLNTAGFIAPNAVISRFYPSFSFCRR